MAIPVPYLRCDLGAAASSTYNVRKESSLWEIRGSALFRTLYPRLAVLLV